MNKILHVCFTVLVFTTLAFTQEAQLSLEDCIAIAMKNNATVLTNMNLNEMAGEDVMSSYSGILPSINFSANTGRREVGEVTYEGDVPTGIDTTTNQAIYERRTITQPGYVSNSNSLTLSVDQNIFDGGEWWNAIRYSKSQKRASDYSFESTKNEIYLNVQQSFFDLLKQTKLLEVYELAVQRSQDQLEKTQKMFDLGAVAKVDVFRSKVNFGNDKIQLLTQQNAILTAKNRLNLVMGRDPNSPLDIKPELNLQPEFNNLDEMTQTAYENNPDLKKSEEDVNSSDINVSRSWGQLSPQLGAYFRYNRSNEELNRVYAGFDKNWNISYGVGLSLNLFNGFRDKVNIQKNKLALRNTQIAYEETKRTIKATIKQLADNYNSYLEIIEINQLNLEAAKEEYRLAEERYRIGSGTQLEVRESQVNLTRAEQTLVAAQYNARITQAQLDQQLGLISRQ